MTKPRYHELEPDEIPVEKISEGISVRVIAGTTINGTTGPVKEISAVPVYLDVSLEQGIDFIENIPAGQFLLLMVKLFSKEMSETHPFQRSHWQCLVMVTR